MVTELNSSLKGVHLSAAFVLEGEHLRPHLDPPRHEAIRPGSLAFILGKSRRNGFELAA